MTVICLKVREGTHNLYCAHQECRWCHGIQRLRVSFNNNIRTNFPMATLCGRQHLTAAHGRVLYDGVHNIILVSPMQQSVRAEYLYTMGLVNTFYAAITRGGLLT